MTFPLIMNIIFWPIAMAVWTYLIRTRRAGTSD